MRDRGAHPAGRRACALSASDEPTTGLTLTDREAPVLQAAPPRADFARTAAGGNSLPRCSGARCSGHWETRMLHYAVVFFIIALIAAVFGFGGIAAGAVGIAKVLFFIFLILAAVSFIANAVRRT